MLLLTAHPQTRGYAMKHLDPTRVRGKRLKSPKLWVKALVYDLDLGIYAFDLRFRSINGRVGKLQVPRGCLKAPEDVVGKLLDAGAILPEERKDAIEFVQKALRTPGVRQIAVTRRGGWHDDSYVTGAQTFGPQRKSLRLLAPSLVDPSFGLKQGTLEAWREGLREPCLASSFLTFALGLGFAGPLLDLIGEDEGAVFNLFGPSSGGKSLGARVLHSEAGRARKSDLATYGISDRGIEELCFARNDWAVVFDEEGR